MFSNYKEKIYHINFSNNLYISILLIFLSISFLILRVLVYTPQIALGHDEPIKWIMAAELSHFEFSGYENEEELNSLHHQLRWGSWIFAFFFQKLFGLSLIKYYISSYFPAILAVFIFSYLILKYLNNFYLLVFFVFIILDVAIYKYAIQLLPDSPGMLGLALFVCFSHLYICESKKNKSNWFLACLSIVCFYLYGVKETNIVFSLVMFCLIFIKEKTIHKILLICFFFLILYVCETIFFQSLGFYSDLKYGRIDALINLKDSLKSNWYQAYFSKFFLKGIFLRLYEDIRPELVVIYFASLIISFHYVTQYKLLENTKLNYLLFVSCTTFLFFVLFNIFFLSSLKPITPAQIYLDRYFTIINPLAYLIIILSFSKYFKNFKNFKILQRIFTAILFLIFFSNPSNYFWNSFKKNEKRNIFERVEQYNMLKDVYLKAECVRSKHHPLVKWLPLMLVKTPEDRSFFQQFRFNKIIYSNGEEYKTVIIHTSCDKILYIDSLYTINNQ